MVGGRDPSALFPVDIEIAGLFCYAATRKKLLLNSSGIIGISSGRNCCQKLIVASRHSTAPPHLQHLSTFFRFCAQECAFRRSDSDGTSSSNVYRDVAAATMAHDELMTLIERLEGRREALTVQEVAELLGVSDKHIYEMTADGTLPSFHVGRSVRLDPQDVADWLRKKKIARPLGL